MNGHDYVLVELVDGNIGDHGIRGLTTKIDYAYRVHGDQFLMHVDDISAHTNPNIRNMRVRVVEQASVSEAELEITPEEEAELIDELLAGPPTDELVDGIPSISSLTTINSRQQAWLERLGILTVKDILGYGEEGLIVINGIGPATAAKVLAEAAQVISRM